MTRLASFLALLLAAPLPSRAQPGALEPWLTVEQNWLRDVSGPVLELGAAGRFDDTHLFAPMIARSEQGYQLWYCGSSGTVGERVFNLGLATGADGKTFSRHGTKPVYSFGDGRHSVLTPTLLRHPDGSGLRENGKLRMWFSSTWFAGPDGLHTLHETASLDGVRWDPPSAPQLDHAYAPTILKSGLGYQMWFTDVSVNPWIIRHAASEDGRNWKVTEQPSLVIDQAWESGRLFYPHVIQLEGVYLMRYGSYWTARKSTTALGFAVSADGVKWRKHPRNPVFRPDSERPWESHYVTSQCVLRLPDGSLRMWYASRKAPPFVNKYFALNTVVWKAPLWK